MTLSINLHSAERSELNTYVSRHGEQCVTIYAKEFQGHKDSVDVWFPAALAVEIHEAIERHRKSDERMEHEEVIA